MNRLRQFLKYAVASGFVALAPQILVAQAVTDVDAMFEELKQADPGRAGFLERQIIAQWSRSGSDAMDLLLERGREALASGNPRQALEHFSALVDHAPEFTEGYNMRAQAYFEVGLIGPAVADLSVVLAREPRHFGAMTGLMALLEQTGKPESAREVLSQIEAIHPNLEGLAQVRERLDLALDGQSL